MTDNKNSRMSSIGTKQDIEIEIATRPVLLLWQGREKSDDRHGIIGVPAFCKKMKGIESAIKDDDPYADFFYHKIENEIEDLAYDLDTELKDITTFIEENKPDAMRLPDVLNDNPTVVPVRIASRLGFQIVYQLLKVDKIILKVLQANHIGLLANKPKFQTLNRVEKRVRKVLYAAVNYRHTGVTRDDMAANNQKAQLAIEQMGLLEEGFLEGSVRSENAPKLPQKRLQALKHLNGSDAESRSAADIKDLNAELDRMIDLADEEAANSEQPNQASA